MRASLVAQPWKIRLQCSSCRFNHWVGKIPWRRRWQPNLVFLAWSTPWTGEPGGLQSIGLQTFSWTQLKWLNTQHPLIHKDMFVWCEGQWSLTEPQLRLSHTRWSGKSNFSLGPFGAFPLALILPQREEDIWKIGKKGDQLYGLCFWWIQVSWKRKRRTSLSPTGGGSRRSTWFVIFYSCS